MLLDNWFEITFHYHHFWLYGKRYLKSQNLTKKTTSEKSYN